MQDKFVENFWLLFQSLSPYYVFSVLISVFAIIFSMHFNKKYSKEILQTMNETDCQNTNDCEEHYDEDSKLEPDNSSHLETLQSRIKVARHQAIVNHLSAKLTPEQLVEEKQTEKAQLEAILNLLKKQEEKFHVSDMTEVEEQLSLYR